MLAWQIISYQELYKTFFHLITKISSKMINLIVWGKHWCSYIGYDKQAREIIHLSCQYWPASVSQTPRKLSFPISMLSKSTALVLFPVFFLLRYSSNFLNTWWGDFLAVVSISNTRNQKYPSVRCIIKWNLEKFITLI